MSDNNLLRRLYVPNVEHWTRLSTKNYFSDQTPKVKTLEHGIILPAKMKEYKEKHRYKGGVCDQNFKFVAGYSNIAPNKLNGWCCIDESYTVDRAEIIHSDEDVIWGGAMIFHFGHFITECMSRMWYVVEHPDDSRKVVFVKVNTWKPGDWTYQFLELLGLPKDRLVFLDKPTQFRSITIPEQSSRIKLNYTDKFLLPFQKMRNAVTPRGADKKIFLTRSKELKTQMYLANADYFEDFYRKLGFKIVAPETLSAVEQLELITGADEIVSHMGTLAHWSLFCRPNVDWTFLTRIDEFNSRQCLINQATQIDWHLVSTSMNFMYSDQGGGVCLIGPTEHWRRFVQEKYHVHLSADERIPEYVIDDYVRHWCTYFVKPEHMTQRRKTLKKIYGQMIMLEARLKLGRPVLCFEAHQARKGWLPVNIEGDVCGEIDKKLSLQALKIYFSEPLYEVKYAVYYPDEGWTETVGSRELAGTTGKNKGICGVSIALEGQTRFDVIYRVHNVNGEWSPWQGNGAKLISLEYVLDGIQIGLQPRRIQPQRAQQ